MTLQTDMRRDGYVILRGLLRPDEIARLRGELRAHFARSWHAEGLGKHQPEAALKIPAIGWIYHHPAILQGFRAVSGSDALVFTANSDAHMNMLSWWHKDTSENQGGCFSGDYFARPGCNVFRAGIYLQDQSHKGGLTVRPGSQTSRSPMTGPAETLKTAAGDVVFFDIRLSHAGQFPDPVETALLRAARIRRLRSTATVLKHGWHRLMRKPDKLSLFFTYGAAAADTEEFCHFEWNRQARGRNGIAPPLTPVLSGGLERAGVRFGAMAAGG
ncbi:phytanoyl-CoA dioxygenase family protein [Roseomonas haemaphysalidis]|uniref:Phytanoyl-CoA dioxygenase family protein n=1 Tax=Roseomonas haemaphysalidis TaxID=2768162 RepID=A0ABS3KVC8_9PROT|nr:phytanoyl-CoA dioxygenase family protein [Roseomonas haemaphysalidis]MBO1081431.1 phytanoyl-CoA dioxygenase family protein [Roseomonas haemaphysalidis]